MNDRGSNFAIGLIHYRAKSCETRGDRIARNYQKVDFVRISTRFTKISIYTYAYIEQNRSILRLFLDRIKGKTFSSNSPARRGEGTVFHLISFEPTILPSFFARAEGRGGGDKRFGEINPLLYSPNTIHILDCGLINI